MRVAAAFARWLCVVWALAPPGVAAAQDAEADAPDAQTPVWTTTGRTVELFPAGDVFPVYVADPHRATNQIATAFYSRTRIPETDSPRFLLAAGGRFGLLRLNGTTPDRWAWQLSVEAGLDAVFDSTHKNDGIGWDGNYGGTISVVPARSRFSFKVALLHLSAHLGDEYEARTGAERINYTREELAGAIAWQPRPSLRLYGELGVAYVTRSPAQEKGRWQGGVEYEHRPGWLRDRAGWYAAADLSALQERDWRVDTALQSGLVSRNHGRTYRLYVQWYDGRPPLGQFTWYSEASLSVGFKVDL